MGHEYYLKSHIWNEEELPNINIEEVLYNKIDSENASDTNISIQEKIGDDYLIELYRQRKFLYDKTDKIFKDNDLKNNSWNETSTIMAKDKNLGKHYTPEYCKKRITSLREQYVKLKKEYDLKSGSAAFTKKQSSLLSQLCFLNKYIQIRRTLTNIKQKENEQMSTTSLNKYAAVVGQETTQQTQNINVI